MITTHTYRVGDRVTTLHYRDGHYVGRTHETVCRRRRRPHRPHLLTEEQQNWCIGALVLGTSVVFALAIPVMSYFELLP